ncbi:MAG: hypothetical protein LBC19_05010 [Tannerella sp.]|jgi:hypothetical protein|nr:hypothetical protein [Tannerella sp.]
MSKTKGFEVKFRDCSVKMSECQLDVMSVTVRKEDDLFSVGVTGLMNDRKTHCTLGYAYGLGEGDEITIERKALEQSSAPVTLPDSHVPDRELPDKAWKRHMLAFFHDMEAYLKGKGLI